MTSMIFDKDISNIKNIINSHNIVNSNNKIQMGEVFTPFNLIIEMVDHFPKSLWKNPNLKWLDPGSGIGNFSMIIYHYLNNGLKSWEPDKVKRHNHIISNMIYMIEISDKNIKIAKKVFGNSVNICHCDFIKEQHIWKKQFNLTSFDIIYGNPPYNTNGMRGKGRSNPGLRVLWTQFLNYSLDILNKNGYILYLTPNSWTELKSPLAKKMLTNNNILVLKNFDVVNSYKLFDKQAGSLPLSYYLLHNSNDTYKSTLIFDSTFDKYIEFNIRKYMIIPNKNIELIKKVLNKNENSLSSYFKFTPPKDKKDKKLYSNTNRHPFIYPLINYVHKKIYISYCKTPTYVQNKRPKLIFPNYSMGYPILDINGILDVGGRSSYYIEIPDNSISKLRKIQKLFLTNFALTIINSLKTAQKFMSTRTFNIFPDVTKFNFDINDTTIQKYYNFNKDHLYSINKQLNDGEGNLSNNQIEQLLNFSISNYKKSNTATTNKKNKYKNKTHSKTIKK